MVQIRLKNYCKVWLVNSPHIYAYGSMNQSMPELTKYQFYIDFDNLQLFNDYKEICANSKLSFYEKNVDLPNIRPLEFAHLSKQHAKQLNCLSLQILASFS